MKTETKKQKHRITRSLILMLVGALFVLGVQAGLRFKEYDDKYIRVYDSSYGTVVTELQRSVNVVEFESSELDVFRKMEIVIFDGASNDAITRVNLTVYTNGSNKYVKLWDVRKYVIVY